MSQENVELVKSLFAAFADRDLDAAASVLHPEVVIRPAIVGGPEGVVLRRAIAALRPRGAAFTRKPAIHRPLRRAHSAVPGLLGVADHTGGVQACASSLRTSLGWVDSRSGSYRVAFR
ncbi:MAG: hypothetical protein ACM33U_12410 [Solirubrobacterales bacterium]